MKLRYLIIAVVTIAFSCNDDEKESKKTKTELLTGGSSKSWYITAETPEEEDPNCRPSADREKDNSWTFYADGKFVFDHGTITETETCGDVINFTGTWEFTNNETGIIIAHPTFGEFANGTIYKLEEREFIVGGGDARVTYTPK